MCFPKQQRQQQQQQQQQQQPQPIVLSFPLSNAVIVGTEGEMQFLREGPKFWKNLNHGPGRQKKCDCLVENGCVLFSRNDHLMVWPIFWVVQPVLLFLSTLVGRSKTQQLQACRRKSPVCHWLRCFWDPDRDNDHITKTQFEMQNSERWHLEMVGCVLFIRMYVH